MNPIKIDAKTDTNIKDSCNCRSNCCFPSKSKSHDKTCNVSKDKFEGIKNDKSKEMHVFKLFKSERNREKY